MLRLALLVVVLATQGGCASLSASIAHIDVSSGGSDASWHLSPSEREWRAWGKRWMTVTLLHFEWR